MMVSLRERLRKWRDSVFSALFLAASVVVLVVAPFFLAGEFLSSFRLYLTGTPTNGVIEQCSREAMVGREGVIGFMFSVKTTARPEPVPIEWCHPDASVGKPVTLVYSRAAESGVAVWGEPTLWNITKSRHSGITVITFFALALITAYLTLQRLKTLGVFAIDSFVDALQEVRSQRTSKMVRVLLISEFALDMLFLALLFTALGVLVFTLFKGVLFLESSSGLWFSVLALASITFISSPAPNIIIAWVWKSYRNGALALMRNIIAGVLLFNSIRNLISFAKTANFGTYRTAMDLGSAIAKAILGLD